jgi:acylphosphatase
VRTVRLRVHGRVQGVGYRAWAIERAAALGLDGWVRNRADGTVELVAAGPAAAVDALIESCRRGPRAASVARLEVAEEQGSVAAGFRVLPTT